MTENGGENMTKIQFLASLKKALEDNVPDEVIRENERYYLSYIDEKIRSGKSEREVMDMLGDPALIAKTIIETQGGSGSYQSERSYEREERREERQQETADSLGSYASINGHVLDFNKWYVRLLAGIVAVLLLIVVVAVLCVLFRIALWLAVPVLVVLAIYILYISLFRRH